MFNPLARLLETSTQLTEQDVHRGSRLLVVDGVCAMGMGALTGGPFLAAFALAIGASNYEIGMLVTIALLSQLMQLPGLALTRYFPKRRATVTVLAGTARLLWIFIILIPLLFVDHGITFLLQWFMIAALVGAAAGPAWNSLLRDIIPQKKFGRVFAQRMALGTVLALGLTLFGGWFVDRWTAVAPDSSLYAYSCLFALGLVLGLVATVVVSRLPEPTMVNNPQVSLMNLVVDPVKDRNFRKLLVFLAFWSFGINMAGPFFVIYMLQRIGISLSMVTILTVTSQLANLLFVKLWGRLADRYSFKAVLASSGPLFLFSVLAWCFTTMPERYLLTLPVLFAIHILSGVGLAGVNISATGIALKLSPSEKAHGYMTVFGLVGALAGACGPLVSGLLADLFAARELSLTLNWSDPARVLSVYALNFKALDFVFLIAFAVGMFAMRRLSAVNEEGQIPSTNVLNKVFDHAMLPIKTISSVEGLRNRIALPMASLLRIRRNTGKTPSRKMDADAEQR